MARLKKMELRTCCTFVVIYSLLSFVNGQPFPIFAQNQQGQGNPLQTNQPPQQQTRQQPTTQLSSQFLQNSQSTGVGAAGIPGATNTRAQPVRTVTVPVLPAPAGLASQFGQQNQDAGPIPRFLPGAGQIGRPFTRFGPAQAGAMAAARRRQIAIMQQQAAQQANMVQPGMTAAGRRFQGLASPNQVPGQQQPIGFSRQLQAQQSRPNAMSAVSPNVFPRIQRPSRFIQQLLSQQAMQTGTQQGSPNTIPGQTGSTLQFQTQQSNAQTGGGAGQSAPLLRRQQTGALPQQFQSQQSRANSFTGGQQNSLQGQQQTGATQQARSNAFNRGFGQQTGAQNQQGQAGQLWRPDVRMPGMIGPISGGFQPQVFPGMFPPGRIAAARAQNRFGTRQIGQTRFTGNTNTVTQTSQLGAPVINPRDPRVGMMPSLASLSGFGSRQRPFPIPTNANGANNRANTAAQAAQRTVTNRGTATFPANQQMIPGGFPGRMPTGMQGMQRAQMAAMTARRAQQAAQMTRAQNRANMTARQAARQGRVPPGFGAFPGSQTGTSGIVPPVVGAFPGSESATGNEVQPSDVAAFPGSETASVETSVAKNELPSSVSAFPGAEPVAEINLPNNVPGFPGTEPAGFDSSRSSGFPGAEQGLMPGELPPPPPVFPASDIANIPTSADADLFPPVDSGADKSRTGTSNTASTSFGIPRPIGGSSASTVDVSVVGSSGANQPGFPGGIDNAPTKEGEMSMLGSSNSQASPGAFPSNDAGMAPFPSGGSSVFPGGAASGAVSGFPGGDAASSVSSFPSANTAPMFPGSDSGSVSGFPGGQSSSSVSSSSFSETSSRMAGFPGSDSSNMAAFPSFPSINGPPDTPSFPGSDKSSGTNSGQSSKVTTVTTSKKVSILPAEETSSSFPVGGVRSGPDVGIPVGGFPGGSNVAPGISGVPIHIWDPSSASNV